MSVQCVQYPFTWELMFIAKVQRFTAATLSNFRLAYIQFKSNHRDQHHNSREVFWQYLSPGSERVCPPTLGRTGGFCRPCTPSQNNFTRGRGERGEEGGEGTRATFP